MVLLVVVGGIVAVNREELYRFAVMRPATSSDIETFVSQELFPYPVPGPGARRTEGWVKRWADRPIATGLWIFYYGQSDVRSVSIRIDGTLYRGYTIWDPNGHIVRQHYSEEVITQPPWTEEMEDQSRSTSDWRDSVIYEMDLSRIRRPGCDLRSAYVVRSDLSHADLTECRAAEADLQSVGFREATLLRAEWDDVRGEFLDFRRANLKGIRFRRAALSFCNFEQSNLDGADFSGARLYAVDFAGATLALVSFKGATLDRVDLSTATELTLQQLEGVTLIRGRYPEHLAPLLIESGRWSPSEETPSLEAGASIPEIPPRPFAPDYDGF
ncbi:MAG: pentapeptide repeat-containing protein [Planctomycetota bacterium]